MVRGRASDKLKEIYATVQAGQQIGYEHIRDGVNGKEVHQNILNLFAVSRISRPGGSTAACKVFFTARDMAWDWIFTNRRASRRSMRFYAPVMSSPSNPGLYYLGVGGVRLEDVVVVTAKGNRNLTDCPQFLEI